MAFNLKKLGNISAILPQGSRVSHDITIALEEEIAANAKERLAKLMDACEHSIKQHEGALMAQGATDIKTSLKLENVA